MTLREREMRKILYERQGRRWGEQNMQQEAKIYQVTEYNSNRILDASGIGWDRRIFLRAGIHEFPVQGYPDQVGPAPIQGHRTLHPEDVEEILEMLSDHVQTLHSVTPERNVETFFPVETVFPDVYDTVQQTSPAPRCILNLEFAESMIEDLSIYRDQVS